MSIFKNHIDEMGAYKPPLDGRDPKKHTLLDFNERTLPVAKVVEDALVEYKTVAEQTLGIDIFQDFPQ